MAQNVHKTVLGCSPELCSYHHFVLPNSYNKIVHKIAEVIKDKKKLEIVAKKYSALTSPFFSTI